MKTMVDPSQLSRNLLKHHVYDCPLDFISLKLLYSAADKWSGWQELGFNEVEISFPNTGK